MLRAKRQENQQKKNDRIEVCRGWVTYFRLASSVGKLGTLDSCHTKKRTEKSCGLPFQERLWHIAGTMQSENKTPIALSYDVIPANVTGYFQYCLFLYVATIYSFKTHTFQRFAVRATHATKGCLSMFAVKFVGSGFIICYSSVLRLYPFY